MAGAQPISHAVQMNNAEFQLRDGGDPRLAVHASSHLPAWLWSTDGTRILWANPVGAKLFGAADAAALDENLWPGRSASAPGGATRRPAAANRRNASRAAARIWGGTRHAGDLRLRAAGFFRWRRRHPGGRDALTRENCSGSMPRNGPAPMRRESRPSVEQAVENSYSTAPEQPTEAVEATGHLVVEPLPESPDHAEIEPMHQPDAAAMDLKTPDYEQAATTGEAPAEFALIDEVTEPAEPVVEHVVEARSEEITSHVEVHEEEPSPLVEAVADEPSSPSADRTVLPNRAAGRGRNCRKPTSRRRCKPSSRDPPPFTRHHGTRRIRGGIRCASCGRWTPRAASCSAPMNSAA